MPALLEPDASVVQHNQTYDLEGLKKQARELADASEWTRAEIGARLDPPISGSAVSRALSESDTADYPGVLARIISLLSNYEVREEPVVFRLKRKGRK